MTIGEERPGTGIVKVSVEGEAAAVDAADRSTRLWWGVASTETLPTWPMSWSRWMATPSWRSASAPPPRPFVVKNPLHGTAGHVIASEVPWRDETRVRTARKHELRTLLAPRLTVPEILVHRASLTLHGTTGANTEVAPRWTGQMVCSVENLVPKRLTLPVHRIMLGYLRELGAVRPAPVPGRAAGTGHLLDRFGTFLADERGLAGKTRRAHLDSARRFLAAAVPDSESGPLLSALTASDVTAFLAGMVGTVIVWGRVAWRSTGE